jgi:hypothetical protein
MAQDETLQNPGMKMLRIVCVLLLTTVSLAAFAEDGEQLWQAIEQLQMRIERLEAKTGIAVEQNETAPVDKHETMTAGKVYTRYWLSKNARFDENSEAPVQQGLMSLGKTIKLDPKIYGYNSSGFFDRHKDPSLFPVAAVIIEGELDIKQGGIYQLTVKPTPPREVGGAGNVEVSVEVALDGDKLFTMPFSKSLASHQNEVRIKAGRQPFRIRIVARSPGFGPSPTRTVVYIGLQAEAEITSYPVNAYLATDQQI